MSTDRRVQVGDAPPVSEVSTALPSHAPNGYGLLRLCLASLVILQHTLALTGHESYATLGFNFHLGHQVTIGEIAVGGFFSLSGFLLYPSVRRNAPKRFIKLRFFRLFPGFWAALIVVAFVFAPLIGLAANTLGTYRLVGHDSALSYIAWNAGLLINQPTIGEVLEHNPYSKGLNGSFWTLLPEFCCYIALLCVTLFARRLKIVTWVTPAVMLVLSLLMWPVTLLVLSEDKIGVAALLINLPISFFAGVLCAALNLSRYATWLTTFSAGAVAATILVVGAWLPFGPVALTVFVIFLGAMMKTGFLSRVGTRRDFSYGVYLYHFPVVQLLVALGFVSVTVPTVVLVLSPLTLLLTVPIAMGSWFLVEAPAQRLGRRKKKEKGNIVSVPGTEL